MNGVPIEVIATDNGVEVGTPKSRTFVKTDEATFRMCYERGLELVEFGPAKAELYLKQYEMDEGICELIKTELVINVLAREFGYRPSSQIADFRKRFLENVSGARTGPGARAMLKKETFTDWQGIVFALEKLRDFYPCRKDVAHALFLSMMKLTQAELDKAQGEEAKARIW